MLGDTGNGCKFELKTDEDRTCCYMNKEIQNDPDYNICRDHQSEECISKKRFEVSEPKGQGKCILILKNFTKSDAGIYIVEFPNESKPSNQRKLIEIQERKTEIKEIVVGQTAAVVFKGDIKRDGCKFMAYLSERSKTCCYEDKRRQSCKLENKCTDYRTGSSYEVREDGNKCMLYLRNFQTSDVGDYEVIFPADQDDDESFQIKEVSPGVEARWIVIRTVLAACSLQLAVVIVIGFIGFKLAKYKFRQRIDDGKLTEGQDIFDALHNLNKKIFIEKLGRRNILNVRDSNRNNLFHKVADKNWTKDMTDLLKDHCKVIFEPQIEDPENMKMNQSYSKRQQIFITRLPHQTWWITKKTQITTWIFKVFGHSKMADYYIHLDSQNKSGKTPLHIAAEKNELDIVKVLLENDADPSIVDNHNCTPLQRAVLNKQCNGIRKPDNIEIVQLLLEKAGPMSKTVNGQNILHSAVMRNNLEVIKLIIVFTANKQQEQKQLLKERYSKEVTDRKTNYKKVQWTGKTPLELAAKFGHKEIVEYLAKKDKFWSTENENGGMPVIFSAVSSSHRYIVDHLLQHGGTFKPDWIIKQEEGDNALKKLIREKNNAAVNKGKRTA